MSRILVKWNIAWILLLLPVTMIRAIEPDVTVSLDGSGDYTSIQAAIEAAPANASEQHVIFIKNGTYDEQLFIEKDFITLIGEDRDSTVIVQAILRRIFRETNDSDWGVATINIHDDVTDFTLANLTVLNNFADVNPDVPNNNDHTMAIRGGGHRIKIVNCNIIATGGDTLSLWNTGGGMYYHASCYFEGYVDYVCPRGYCYIEGSDFFGHNRSASIWHDGSGGKDHKFVIRNSNFEGVQDFPLGRYHRMAAFYLLDCWFAEEMADQNITYVGDSTEQDRDKLVYGPRTYYHNCQREGGNYEWHADNLKNAENSPTPDVIDAKWTFNNAWDPVTEIYGLLPVPILPTPMHKAQDVESDQILSWFPVEEAVSYNVYLGTEDELEYAGNTIDTVFDPQGLENQSRYTWRVDAITETDTTEGELWKFSTQITAAPEKAFHPSPSQGETVNSGNFYLEWDYIDWITDSFYVYFGPSEDPELFRKTTTDGVHMYNVENGTNYWRVDAINSIGTTTGDLWEFTYHDPALSNVEVKAQTENFSINPVYPNPTTDEIHLEVETSVSSLFHLQFYTLSGILLYKGSVYIHQGAPRLLTFDLHEITGHSGNHHTILCKVTSQGSKQLIKLQLHKL